MANSSTVGNSTLEVVAHGADAEYLSRRGRRRANRDHKRAEAESEARAHLNQLAPVAEAASAVEISATQTSLSRANTTKGGLLIIAYFATSVVWGLGALWSFTEQTRAAAALGFEIPWVLPVLLDGLGVALALVAVSAALDARSAVLIRLGVLAAIAGSGYFNVVGVLIRWDGAQPLWQPITMALVAPVSSNLALEVLLSATRRHVQRLRGLPPPVAVPAPHPLRLISAPITTFRAWRQVVLVMTDPRRMVSPSVLAMMAQVAEHQRAAEAARNGEAEPTFRVEAAPSAAGAAHAAPVVARPEPDARQSDVAPAPAEVAVDVAVRPEAPVAEPRREELPPAAAVSNDPVALAAELEADFDRSDLASDLDDTDFDRRLPPLPSPTSSDRRSPAGPPEDQSQWASSGALRESALVASGSPRIADIVVQLAAGARLTPEELRDRYGVNFRTGKRYLERADVVLAELRDRDAQDQTWPSLVGS